ncbi:MAG: ABC transporter ATP-binding protein [Myxococcaceae bacterium]
MAHSSRQHLLGLWKRWGRAHQGPLLRAAGAMAVLAACNAGLALLAGPAVRTLIGSGPAQVTLPGLAGRWVPPLDVASAPRFLVGALLVVAVFKGVAYFLQFYWAGDFAQRVVSHIRGDVAEHLLHVSPLQLRQERIGEKLTVATSDVSVVETAAHSAVPAFARDGLQLLALFAAAFVIDPSKVWICLVLAVFAASPAARLTRGVVRRTQEGQSRLGKMGARFLEGLRERRTLQAFGAQAFEVQRFAQEGQAHRRLLVRAAARKAAVPALLEWSAAAALVATIVFGFSGMSDPAATLSFCTVLVLAYQPAKELGRTSQMLAQAAVSAERLLNLSGNATGLPVLGAGEVAPLSSEIRFEQVAFAYGERARPVLKRVSLTIPQGKVVAVVGRSGAGKSTLMALLMRWAEPAAGRILWDGCDIGQFSAPSLRRHIAYVMQEPFLYGSSVLENLRLGRPQASKDEVLRACAEARASDVIAQLPQGVDTVLGEAGLNLSGGQRQRLCIARALVQDAPVWLLDEPWASLDAENAREVALALRDAVRGRTALLISHTLALTADADHICVLHEGEISESGTHAALLEKAGEYARLWSLQMQGRAA